MTKLKTDFILFCVLIILSLSSNPALVLSETSCERADELFQKTQSLANNAVEKPILEKAVALCPEHAAAWNNLGLVYEQEGQFDKAEQAYRQALEYRPDLAAPLAGLGDIAMAQGRFQVAIQWYERFLTYLSAELQKGDPQGLAAYEEEYRQKYEQAKLRWQIHEGSMTEVVPKTTLTRGLRSIRVKQKVSNPTGPERLSLFINFDFDSAALKPQGRAQLVEVARTMLSAELQADPFLIEGHSDTIGSDDYNFELSRQRAEKVRFFLISQGVGFKRLTTKSYGESRPIVPAGGKQEQAINRRVEFVRIGP